ncbi:MAG TPA: asparagine synthase-related protein [Solirubrobacteraceae bacterium]
MAPSGSTEQPLRPTPLEVASGVVVGEAPAAAPPDAGGGLSPRQALERLVLPALLRPPCLVSFSGGRDSSLVLTIAAHVARREGLPLPSPITVRVADAPAAQEDWHQQTLLHHLGLTDQWIRLDVPQGEFDWVGPVAGRVLRRHGLLWPPNAFFHAPLFEQARGGSLLTGVGGDQMMATWRSARAMQVVSGRARPAPRDALHVGLAFAPRAVRAAVRRRRDDVPSWLRPPVARDVMRRRAAEDASEPRRWDRRLPWVERRRILAATRWSLALIAADSGTHVAHPLADPLFVGALARAGGAGGLGDRRAIINMLLSDLLPDVLLGRADKALFQEVFFSAPFREFVRTWDGRGVDPALVDVERLRAEWAQEVPHSRTALVLQAAWLSAQGGEAVDRGIER